MDRYQIIMLARCISSQYGLARAAHYLRSIGWPVAIAAAILAVSALWNLTPIINALGG